MVEDRERNLVGETLDVLKELNRKIQECANLEIKVFLAPCYTGNGLPYMFLAEFTKTEHILPARGADGD